MKKILLGINTLTEVNQAAYLNHMILSYRLGRSYRSYDFGICCPRRMQIDNMRNFCAKAAIDGGFDYLWFLDDDVLLQADCLRHLLDLRSDIAAGITLIRGYPYNPMLFSFDKKRRNGSSLVEYQKLLKKSEDNSIRKPILDAVGFSCCLINTKLLRKVEPPWFLTGPNFTEDVFFCQRALTFKKDLTVAATGHVLTEHLLGTESISPMNRSARIAYDRVLNPSLLKLGHGAAGAAGVLNADPNAERYANIRGAMLARTFRPETPNRKAND